jgi:hypothetical protein
MAQKLSQLYDVDNRYKEAQGVADNVAGKRFLKEFIARDKELAKDPVEPSRREDDKFILPAQGGTIPIASIGLTGSLIGNTDSRTTFRNAFRASQS